MVGAEGKRDLSVAQHPEGRPVEASVTTGLRSRSRISGR